MEKQAVLTDALIQIAGGSCADAIMYTFRRMDIAEEEIRNAKIQQPELAERIDTAFRHLCPTPPLLHVSDKVYRLHCREIIDRMVKKHDLETATKAEILGMLSETSLKAPLNETATLLYEKLFSNLFPGEARKLKIDHSRLDRFDQKEISTLEANLTWKNWPLRTA